MSFKGRKQPHMGIFQEYVENESLFLHFIFTCPGLPRAAPGHPPAPASPPPRPRPCLVRVVPRRVWLYADRWCHAESQRLDLSGQIQILLVLFFLAAELHRAELDAAVRTSTCSSKNKVCDCCKLRSFELHAPSSLAGHGGEGRSDGAEARRIRGLRWWEVSVAFSSSTTATGSKPLISDMSKMGIL
jgi:hypothetical protein